MRPFFMHLVQYARAEELDKSFELSRDSAAPPLNWSGERFRNARILSSQISSLDLEPILDELAHVSVVFFQI